jgi:NitT/TauT family transport system substrate-binding protein
MDRSTPASLTRRRFISSSVAFAAAPLLAKSKTAAAQPPPEISTIRLEDFPAICLVPAFLAEELLYAEGFSRVEYVTTVSNALPESDEFDLTLITAPALVNTQDTSPRWLAIAGIHSGCQELFGNDRVRTIRDLKGKSVAISAIGSGEHVFVSSVAAYVGIDPKKDINWVVANGSEAALQRFVDGKADAYLAFEPQPYLLKEKKIGHVILNTTEDKPWSQYFCCMAVARRDFVRRYPIATKRALRAILKASDICAREPERAARYLIDKGHESRYELSLDVLKALPFDRWREANPEDTLRFHALRLHEAGMIKNHPNKLIAQGTDRRFLNAIKKELKA